MQQTGHLLDFWARSYDQFGGRCTCCLVAARELQKTPQSSTKMTFGLLLLVLVFTPIYEGCSYYIYTCTAPFETRLIEEFLEQPHIIFSTIACELMEGSLSNPCVASSFEVVYAAASSAPNRYSWSIDSRLCSLVLWECGWTNPQFKMPVKGLWD
jgi:hypothetical protein